MTSPDQDSQWQALEEKLEKDQQWPGEYTFKFVVPKKEVDQLKSQLDSSASLTTRESKTGKYISVTFKEEFDSPQAVVNVYRKVCSIPGIISL